MSERKFPPFTEVGMATLALVIAGGIYLSAHLPERVSLAPAVVLLVVSGVAMALNLLSLTRVQSFAWDSFFLVAKWALLAYCFTAGAIEYIFIRNHVRGSTLVVLTLSLVLFAVQVPALIGFTVARFQEPAAPTPAGS